MKSKTTSIKVLKTDVELAKKIKADLGCTSMKELFHRFVSSYYAVSLVQDLVGEKHE